MLRNLFRARYLLSASVVAAGAALLLPAGADTPDAVKSTPPTAGVVELAPPAASETPIAASDWIRRPADAAPAPIETAAIAPVEPARTEVAATPGWVPADAKPQGIAAGADLRVAASALNVRSGPSTASEKLFVLQPRQPVSVLETSGSWARVLTDKGEEGWAYVPLLADPNAPIVKPKRNTSVVLASESRAQPPARSRRTTLFDYLDERGMLAR